LPAEPEVAAAVRDAAQVFAGLGARVTEGSPDFAGADEAFRTLRAWQFEVMLGELLDRHPGELKDSPAGFSAGGLPVGVQIVGPHRADFAVLQAGHAFEQATQAGRRRPPGL
jgi:amidase